MSRGTWTRGTWTRGSWARGAWARGTRTRGTWPRGSWQPAPRWLRLAALCLDASLAVLVLVALRLLVTAGNAEALGATDATGPPPLVGLRTWILAALAVLLRDVPFGASPAKWLLCLRLARPDGSLLALPARLRAAPLGILPVPRALEKRLGYLVVAYAPSRAGLLLRGALAGSATALSLFWSLDLVRPSIPPADARLLAEALLRSDPRLRDTLGEPLRCQLGRVTPRTLQRRYASPASFELRIHGPRAAQQMLVHARRVEGTWTVEELSDIEITVARADSPDVARR